MQSRVDHHFLTSHRFITPLRYLFVRQQRGVAPPVLQGALLDAVRGANPAAHAAAVAIQELLRERYAWTVTGDEVLYLTLHVSRLAGAVGTP
jgi:beta-glucoside operon transcriptional antiterminator